MIEKVGFIPQLDEKDITYETKTIGSIEVDVPILTTEQLLKIAAKVKENSRELRATFTMSEIVDILDRVTLQLLDRTNPYRQKAETLLPLVTGYDAEMIRLGLTTYLKTFRKQQLLQFVVEDFGNPLLLDDFQPRAKGGYAKALGPSLTAHIWAGNVPALPIWSLISSLLVKGGSIGKVSSAEPLFAGWYAKVLAEVEPRLANCLAIVWWQGGDEDIELSLFQQADVVVAYGGNESLSSIKSRVPVTTRFLPYGHKIGFGFITKESLNSFNAKETAKLAAYDTMRYDQQGCYSPHIFFVESGGQVSPKQLSEYVAHELAAFEQRYPRRELSFAEETEIVSWKQKEELSVFTNKEKVVLSPSNGDWTVVYEKLKESFEPTPLNRFIRIIEVESFEEVFPVIQPYKQYLQTVGIAASPEELFQLSSSLAELGITRITALGQMTAPSAGWHHDGTWSLLDLVRMVDLERSAEDYAETISSYRN